MSAVTISVMSDEEAIALTLAAFRGEPQGSHIAFSSDEELLRVLSPVRWSLVKAMAGKGAMSIRHAARLVGRGLRAVHADVHLLLGSGVLQHAEGGGVVFPYDVIRLELTVRGERDPAPVAGRPRRRPVREARKDRREAA